MENYSLSVSDAVGNGWECAKKHGLMVAVILLGIWVITRILGNLTGPSMDIETARLLGEQIGRGNMDALRVYRDYMVSSTGSFIMGLVLNAVIYVGLYNLALGLMSGMLKEVEINFAVFKLPLIVYVKYVVLDFLVGVICAVSVSLCVIPAFFIIPRIIFAPIYLIDNPHAGVIESLTKSWEMTTGNTWSIICLGLVFFGILIVGLLCCCIGVFFAEAVILFAFAAAYYQMRGRLV